MNLLPWCVGGHVIAPDAYFYTINPEGGYDRGEVLCCEKCIRLPKFNQMRIRMIEVAGCKELE